MTKIVVALIHNNNEERNARVRPNVEKLADQLRKSFEVESLEFSYQPNLVPHTKVTAFLRDVLFEFLERRWQVYLERPSWSWFKTVRNLRKVASRYLNNPEDAARCCRSGAIDAFVTNKHLRSWEACMERGADYLIVLEDDAVFHCDSIDRITSALDKALYARRPAYIDLAGGFSASTLQIEHLARERDDRFVQYRKMVTNTACAYLLNSNMIERSLSILLSRPYYRLITIDWLMNRLFMDLEDSGIHGLCFHTDPLALQHGSFTGDFSAWER